MENKRWQNSNLSNELVFSARRHKEVLTSGEDDVSVKLLKFLQQLNVDFL